MRESYFIAETAFHHQGEPDYLISLVDGAKNAGADGVKFQVLMEPGDFLSSKHSAFHQLSAFCLRLDQWKTVFQYTQDAGLDIILMPIHEKALELACAFSVKYIDIHSVSFNDRTLLAAIRSQNLPVILGVGGRRMDEIAGLLHYFKGLVQVLMAGFQSYPSKLQNVKLGRISRFKLLWPELRIGYADHSSFDSEFCIKSSEYARLLGADVFEKHVTLNEGENRVDYEAAVSFDKFARLISAVRFIDRYIVPSGDDFVMSPEEVVYRNRQLRCVAKSGLKKGQIIGENDVVLKMTDEPGGLEKTQEVIGKRILEDVGMDGLIRTDSVVCKQFQ